MRVVDFHKVHPRFDRPLDRCDPGLLELLDLGLGHGLGRGELVVEWNVAWAFDIIRPPSDGLGGRVRHTEPGRHGAGFAACVRELDSDDLVLTMYELYHSTQWLDL